MKTAEALRVLQAEWKAIGPVPRAVSQRVWERFRKPCDRFFTRFQEHRERAQPRVGAEPREEGSPVREGRGARRRRRDWEEAAAGIKQLQAEWRAIGPVKKSRAEAVWQRFRAACDLFFDRYKNRDAHAREAAREARERICAELEALAPDGGAAAASRPPTSCARVQAAQTAWRQAGGLPQDEMAALDERFCRVRDRLLELYPRAFEGSELDPEASRRRAEKLVARVEGAARGASRRRRRARPQNAGRPRRAAARRARVEHDRRPGGGRAALALGGGRARGRAGGLEAPRPAAGRRGPRARRALRARPAVASPSERPRPEPSGAPRRRGRSGRGATGATRATGRARAPAALTGGDERADPADLFELFVLAPDPAAEAAAILATYRSARVLAPFPRRGGEDGARWRRIIRAPRAHARRARGARPRTRRSRQGRELRAFGRDLFETLLPGDVRRLYDVARAQRKTGRARRRLHVDARLGGRQALGAGLRPVAPRVPRHLLRELRAQRLHRRARATRRRGGAAGCACWSPSRGRAASSRSTHRSETSDLAKAFRAARGRGAGPRSSVLTRPTPAALQRRLAAGGVDVLHFVGHGHFDAAEREGFLVLEDERGGPRPLGAEALRQVVCQRGLSLVFLNACETGRGGRVDWNRGIGARARRRRACPAVVANQYAVLDSAATLFARELYSGLAAGRALGDAAREARIALAARAGRRRASTGRCRSSSRATRASRCGERARRSRRCWSRSRCGSRSSWRSTGVVADVARYERVGAPPARRLLEPLHDRAALPVPAAVGGRRGRGALARARGHRRRSRSTSSCRCSPPISRSWRCSRARPRRGLALAARRRGSTRSTR